MLNSTSFPFAHVADKANVPLRIATNLIVDFFKSLPSYEHEMSKKKNFHHPDSEKIAVSISVNFGSIYH